MELGFDQWVNESSINHQRITHFLHALKWISAAALLNEANKTQKAPPLCFCQIARQRGMDFVLYRECFFVAYSEAPASTLKLLWAFHSIYSCSYTLIKNPAYLLKYFQLMLITVNQAIKTSNNHKWMKLYYSIITVFVNKLAALTAGWIYLIYACYWNI